MIRISHWRESHCRTTTSIRRNKKIQNSRTVRVTVSNPSRKVNHLSKVIWSKKLWQFIRSISSTRIGEPVLMIVVKVSKDKHISRWVDQENLIYVKNLNFMAPFYAWGSTGSKLEPLQGDSLLFTTNFPEIHGTHFIDLERMKSWVDLGATQQFWTWEPWIGNPVT